MANENSPFDPLFNLWPSVAELAKDLKEKYPTVAAWKQRGSIDPEYWDLIIEAARVRGFEGVTWEVLGRMANGQAVQVPQKGAKPTQPTKSLPVSNASNGCSLSENEIATEAAE